MSIEDMGIVKCGEHRRAHSLTGTHLSQVCVGDDSASFASVSSS